MRPEDRLRARCRMYLDAALPAPGFYTAIEHGRLHHGTDEARAQEWTRLKSQGVKTGLSDLAIWYHGKFIGVELKVKSPVSDSQAAFGRAMKENGFSWAVVHSVLELHTTLERIGVPVTQSMYFLALGHDSELTQPERSRATARARKIAPSRAALSVIQRARAKGVRI